MNQSCDARPSALSASGSLLTHIVAPRCLGEIYLCNRREGRVGDLSVLLFSVGGSIYSAYRGDAGAAVGKERTYVVPSVVRGAVGLCMERL